MIDCPTGILVDLSDDNSSGAVKNDPSVNSSVARNLKFSGNKKGTIRNTEDESFNVSLLEDEKLDMFSDMFTDEEYDIGKQKYGVFTNFEDTLSVKQMVEIFTEAAKLSSIIKSQSLKVDYATEIKEVVPEIPVTDEDCNLSAKMNSMSEESILLPDELSLLRDSCLSNESKDEIRIDLLSHSPVSSIRSTSSDSVNLSQNLKLDQSLLSIGDGVRVRSSVGSEEKDGSQSGGEVEESGKSLIVFVKPSAAVKTSNNASKLIKRPAIIKETTPEMKRKPKSLLTPLKPIPVKYSNQTLKNGSFLTPKSGSVSTPKSGSVSTPTAVIPRRRSIGTPSPTPSRPVTPPVVYSKLAQTPRTALRALNTPSRVPKKNSYEIKAPKWDLSTTQKRKENCK